jgi:glycosyltransferase involved in cell wall biosynthesis
LKKLSIIIPARNEPYLRQTVEDIFFKAAGDVEVLVMMDGWEPESPLEYHSNLLVFHREEPVGMDNAINELASQAQGDYLMKLDAHCCFDEEFDVKLLHEIEDDWLVTPSRYRLDTESFNRFDEPVEYLYVTYPYSKDDIFGTGFHGKKWIGTDGIGRNMGRSEYYWMERYWKNEKMVDIQTIQGSLWLMSRKHFYDIGCKDEVHTYFYQEPQEFTFKTWLRGGRVVMNKNTWYAHWHKPKTGGYGRTKRMKADTERFSTWVWMNDKWPKARRTISWFVDSKFHPMPGWPANWKNEIRDDSNFRIFNPLGNDGYGIDGI